MVIKIIRIYIIFPLKEKCIKQPTLAKLFSTATTHDGDGSLASYNISLVIAKSGNPHIIGEELIILAISEVIHKSYTSQHLILSRKFRFNTVQSIIDEMAQDVEDLLCGYLKTYRFSIQLDESTLLGNEALL